jgi:hypothetical protein
VTASGIAVIRHRFAYPESFRKLPASSERSLKLRLGHAEAVTQIVVMSLEVSDSSACRTDADSILMRMCKNAFPNQCRQQVATGRVAMCWWDAFIVMQFMEAFSFPGGLKLHFSPKHK